MFSYQRLKALMCARRKMASKVREKRKAPTIGSISVLRSNFIIPSFTMNPYISHVYSLNRSLNPKREYNSIKRKILQFRVQELKELLVCLNLNSNGKRVILQERVLKFLKKEVMRKGFLDERLERKIKELKELCKIPIKKKGVQFVEPLYDTQVFYMFSELRQLVCGQKFNLRNGKQSFCFSLTTHLIHKILSGKQADGSYRFEVQLNVWNYTTTEEWNNIYLSVEVNGIPIDVLHPSPHLIYLTCQCHLEPFVKNTITISSPRPETLKDYAFCICVVKRWFPTEIIENNPVKETKEATALLIKKELEGQVNRRFKLFLTCPDTKSIIAYPCRSSLCTHPEVFDLKTFLNEKQYYQQWKCPVCMEVIKYEDIVMDMFLKEYLDKGLFNFMFYKRRAINELTDKVDEEIQCEAEVITIHD